MSPKKLEEFLKEHADIVQGECINKLTGRRIKAVVPMHTFGLPVPMDQLLEVCKKYSLEIVEDAAESLGSYYKGQHTGTFGLIGVLSFNGNKTITTGGGGMLLTNNELLAKKAKHMTTTAKIPHKWEFEHDMIGFNYRLPNINAALGCAQMENLNLMLSRKRNLADEYKKFFEDKNCVFVEQPHLTEANYWLNALILESEEDRKTFLEQTNESGVMTRPIWKLMNKLPMFASAMCGNLDNSTWLEERVVNIPSSVKI